MTPRSPPRSLQDDSKLYVSVVFINISWYLEIMIYKLSGACDFIHGGGLLVRGGEYIYIYIYRYVYMYIYMYI